MAITTDKMRGEMMNFGEVDTFLPFASEILSVPSQYQLLGLVILPSGRGLDVVASIEPWLTIVASIEPWLTVEASVEPWLEITATIEPWKTVLASVEPWLTIEASVD